MALSPSLSPLQDVLPPEILTQILQLAIQPSSMSGARVLVVCKQFYEIGGDFLKEEVNLTSEWAFLRFFRFKRVSETVCEVDDDEGKFYSKPDYTAVKSLLFSTIWNEKQVNSPSWKNMKSNSEFILSSTIVRNPWSFTLSLHPICFPSLPKITILSTPATHNRLLPHQPSSHYFLSALLSGFSPNSWDIRTTSIFLNLNSSNFEHTKSVNIGTLAALQFLYGSLGIETIRFDDCGSHAPSSISWDAFESILSRITSLRDISLGGVFADREDRTGRWLRKMVDQNPDSQVVKMMRFDEA